MPLLQWLLGLCLLVPLGLRGWHPPVEQEVQDLRKKMSRA
jgi:hypothetical protein